MRTKLLFLLLGMASACLAQTTTINGIYGQSIGIPIYAPSIVQAVNCSTASTGLTVACALAQASTQGTTIIDVCGGTNYAVSNWTATVTDTVGNTYTQDAIANQSTTQWAAIFRANNNAGGTNTLTLTIAGSSAVSESLACRAYEVMGSFSPGSPLDNTTTGSNAGSTSPSAGSFTPTRLGEYAFTGIAAGTTSTPTFTASSPWKLDASIVPASGSLTFGVESLPTTAGPSAVTGSATLSASNAWAAVMASYKVFEPVVILGPSASNIGTVQPGNTQNTTPWLAQAAPQSTSTYALTAYDLSATAATQVKSSGGNVWGWFGFNPNASTCFLQFYNSTSATLGTSVLHPFPIPAGAAFNVAPGSLAFFNLGTGISTGQTTTATGSTQCGSAMNVTILYQ